MNEINKTNEDNRMNIIPIKVPEDIDYIGEWESFTLPPEHSILDKTICGCGFTEYCLNNNIPTILCSPRKVLLENKERQHNSEEGKGKGLREIYYFKNDYESSIGFDNDKEIKSGINQTLKSKKSIDYFCNEEEHPSISLDEEKESESTPISLFTNKSQDLTNDKNDFSCKITKSLSSTSETPKISGKKNY